MPAFLLSHGLPVERIGLVLGPPDHVPSRRKLAAARQMAMAATIDLPDEHVEHTLFSVEGGQAVLSWTGAERSAGVERLLSQFQRKTEEPKATEAADTERYEPYKVVDARQLSLHIRTAAGKPEQSPQQFAASLPTRQQIPALLGVVLVQATDAGIVLEQGRYTFSPATSNRLARYTFEFPVKGDYGKIRSFINKSLAAIPALGLDKLHVERKNVGDTAVIADVGFVIYLRGA